MATKAGRPPIDPDNPVVTTTIRLKSSTLKQFQQSDENLSQTIREILELREKYKQFSESYLITQLNEIQNQIEGLITKRTIIAQELANRESKASEPMQDVQKQTQSEAQKRAETFANEFSNAMSLYSDFPQRGINRLREINPKIPKNVIEAYTNKIHKQKAIPTKQELINFSLKEEV